ncbi:DUF427 domain-containing protein [Devosia nitrariae]|uniref:DUF427 domain-containing protein n=1 Tax=Devosia nitrariae TaxID=2071872 RepID=A0ABQ5VZH0_9HYPH|nr:DUF427 domain-containing protein [Devosia nitrariae]GLQ52999.1 hypothetical protein GCM10010862_02570 [Devosia nitrariae]
MTPDRRAEEFSIAPVEGRVHIFVDDAEVIDSRRALRLEHADGSSHVYVPMDDIRSDLLLATDDHRQTALGEVHFYTIRTATATIENAAEYVSEAAAGAEPLYDHVHFLEGRVRCEFSPA